MIPASKSLHSASNLTGLFTAILLLGVVGCDHQPTRASSSQTADTKLLPDPKSLPAFSLTERSGRTVTRDTLAGKVWVANFIFTSCSGQCPRMTLNMSKLQNELKVADLCFVSFTVDPERDRPERLREFAGSYGADGDRWLFLTGDREAIYQLCEKGFLLSVKETPEAVASGGQPILHSWRFVLVDRRGRIRGYYDGTDDAELSLLRTDARLVLADEPPP